MLWCGLLFSSGRKKELIRVVERLIVSAKWAKDGEIGRLLEEFKMLESIWELPYTVKWKAIHHITAFPPPPS